MTLLLARTIPGQQSVAEYKQVNRRESVEVADAFLSYNFLDNQVSFLRSKGKLYCSVLYCTALFCTVLYCTVLYCTVLCCTVLCTVCRARLPRPRGAAPRSPACWCPTSPSSVTGHLRPLLH